MGGGGKSLRPMLPHPPSLLSRDHYPGKPLQRDTSGLHSQYVTLPVWVVLVQGVQWVWFRGLV